MHERMQVDEIGREILQERPVIAESTRIEVLREYPAGTFGKAYADWMEARQYRPEERPEVKYVDDPELAYVMQRYREVHDFVHVLTGLGSTEEEEIAIKWFELLQTGLPVCLLRSVPMLTALSLPFHPSCRPNRKAKPDHTPGAARRGILLFFCLFLRTIALDPQFRHVVRRARAGSSATVGPTRLTSAQRIRMAAEWVCSRPRLSSHALATTRPTSKWGFTLNVSRLTVNG